MDRLLQAFIRQHCSSEASFERGVTYFQQQRVEDATYNREEQTFYAVVRGNQKKYHVELKQRKENIYAWCDCPAFNSFDGFCKHIVAGLFKMDEAGFLNYPGSNKKKQNDTDLLATEQMIQLFEKHRLRMMNTTNRKQPIQIEYLLKSDTSSPFSNGDDLLTLEIKFGVTRLYVVRKIKELLSAIMNEQSYTFTKNFSYDPTEHIILEEDRHILALLYEISNHEKFYKHSQYDYWNMRYTDDRFLMIPPFLADNVIEKLTQRNASFEFIEQVYKPFSFSKESMPLSFQLQSEQEINYQLLIDQERYIYHFQPYGYLFSEGVFYKLEPELRDILPALVEKSVPVIKKSIPIAEEQIEAFITHVVPTLKRIGDLSIAQDVGEKITSEPLRASIFVDYTDEQVQAMIEYNYGDINFDPLKITDRQAITNEKIIMRDSDKEAMIMEIIEHAPFKYNGKELYIDDEEAMYEFLFFTLPLLEEHADIYMTNIAKSLLTETHYTPKTSVDFRSDTNLLEVNFSMDGIEEAEIQQLLQSVIEKKKYFRLSSGAFVSLDEREFSVIGELFNELGLSRKEVNSTLSIPAFRALQVADIVGDKQADKTKFTKSLRQLIESLQNPENLEFELPTQLNAELRDYQHIGFQWFKTLSHYRFGGILADDMGLGKTLQSIAYILSERTEQQVKEPALVICPASLIYNWEREFHKFAPSLNVVVIAGTREERNELIERSKEADVLITSYPLIRRDIDLYAQHQYHILIFDEAQSIKNHYTQTSQAVKKIKAMHRFALSGTPIENSLDELASIFDVILPGLFPSKKQFRQLSEQKISQMVKPFILRRMKRDVLTELPEKIETVHLSELTKQQKELYLGYLENIQKEALNSIAIDGFDKSRMKILAGLTRLRQLCCHPSLFIENYEGDCGKMEQLLELLDESLANGRRILLFSQFTSMLHLIREELDKRGILYFYLDGQTDAKERLQMATEFNEGKHNVFLISLKAGGTGLNLTGADTVILYDLWWNPAVEQQAADRAHRLGQKNVVHVMKLVTKGTIEEKIHELQQKKKALVDQIIQPGETMLTTLSEEDIKELLMLN